MWSKFWIERQMHSAINEHLYSHNTQRTRHFHGIFLKFTTKPPFLNMSYIYIVKKKKKWTEEELLRKSIKSPYINRSGDNNYCSWFESWRNSIWRESSKKNKVSDFQVKIVTCLSILALSGLTLTGNLLMKINTNFFKETLKLFLGSFFCSFIATFLPLWYCTIFFHFPFN